MKNDFWDDPFHLCAIQAGFIAYCEGKLEDSEYVKKLCYEFYKDLTMVRNSRTQEKG